MRKMKRLFLPGAAVAALSAGLWAAGNPVIDETCGTETVREFDEWAACEAAMDWADILSDAEKKRIRETTGNEPEIWAYKKIKERSLENSAKRPAVDETVERNAEKAIADFRAEVKTAKFTKAELKQAKKRAKRLSQSERDYIQHRYGMKAEEFFLNGSEQAVKEFEALVKTY